MEALAKKGGRRWLAKLTEVKDYSKMQKKFEETTEQRLESIRVELRHRTEGVLMDQFELNHNRDVGAVLSEMEKQAEHLWRRCTG